MILITGGAGYIGSQIVKLLIEKNYKVVVFDNLSTGNMNAVDKRALLVKGDLRNTHELKVVFEQYTIDAVLHLASSCYVGESVKNPLNYYDNNLISTINLLKLMILFKVKKIIFSSSCAVYGIPNSTDLNEETPTNPINPYGKSKLMNENIIKDLSETFDIQYIILRFFNVAGADPENHLGEWHVPETHLIPNIMHSFLGTHNHIEIYGNDYSTSDGTCIRDYIHVKDIAQAFILSLEKLLALAVVNEIFNLGTGSGYSVKEIIRITENTSGSYAKISYQPRRKGDPDILIASYQKIKNSPLQWEPEFTIFDIINSAWKWHKTFPNGYQ